MIVAYIDGHKARFGVAPICRVLTEHADVDRPEHLLRRAQGAGVRRGPGHAYLTNEVVTLFGANRRVYGIRKLWHEMRRAGHQVGRDQIGRLMRIAGIEGVVRGRHATTTTKRGEHSAPRHPDPLDRAWDTPTRPDKWWVADFTYVWTLTGFATARC